MAGSLDSAFGSARDDGFLPNESERAQKNENNPQCGANLREKLAVPGIESLCAALRHVHRSAQHTFHKSAAIGILQNLRNPPVAIDKAGHACVRRTDERAPVFDAAEDGVLQM